MRRAAAGFTLIELIAVLAILSILAYFLVTNVGGAKELVDEKATHNKLVQVAAMLEQYADAAGDYPTAAGMFPGAPPNATNVGGETLYLALCREHGPGFGVVDDELCNTDGDRASAQLEGFESRELYELADSWGNPIAYLHHRSYDRAETYATRDAATGEPLEGQVTAWRNEATQRFHGPRAFQLISAGADGAFGTEDDITEFAP